MRPRNPAALQDDPLMPGYFLMPRPETVVEWMRGLEALGYTVLKPGELRIVEETTKLGMREIMHMPEPEIARLREIATSQLAAKIGHGIVRAGLAQQPGEKMLGNGAVGLGVRVIVRVPPKEIG